MLSCKPKPKVTSQRLCERFDLTLLRQLQTQDRTLENCERVHRAIEEGQIRARFYIDENLFPEREDAFLDALRMLHRLIFEDGLPWMAGRFRGPGEAVDFGGAGAHHLDGVAPNEIEPCLTKLYRTLKRWPDTITLEAAARDCARFLEIFFRTHPFLDGNGRVGRLVILWMCGTWSRFVFRPFARTGQLRRRYFRALEYAHQHAPASTHVGWSGKADPYGPLARWLARHMDEVPLNAGEEAGPPSLT